MMWKAKVEVNLKLGITDAEGETTRDSLRDLGYSVEKVRVGKVYEVHLHARSAEEARKLVNDMCRRLLANPDVKDDYSFELEEQR